MTTSRKCQCGSSSCNQYTLSTQGSVGFHLDDATRYAASEDLLAVCRQLVGQASGNPRARLSDLPVLVGQAILAVEKATSA